MGAYQTVAVGTDGSDSSYRAVDKAAEIAADSGATLLIICAYHPERDTEDADHALGSDAFLVVGSSPAEQKLQTARQRAEKAGAQKVDTVAREGDPVEVVGTSQQLSATDGDIYDWAITWADWKSMSALARAS